MFLDQIWLNLKSYHGHSFWSEDFWDRQSGVKSDVGQNVHNCHQNAGNGDGPRKISERKVKHAQ